MTDLPERPPTGKEVSAKVTAADPALFQRLSNVLHDMGLPCACQDEVERTLSVFAEFEIRRSRRRLIEAARARARTISAALPYLEDIHGLETASPHPDDVAALIETFRHISEAAAQAAANLEILSGLGSGDLSGKT